MSNTPPHTSRSPGCLWVLKSRDGRERRQPTRTGTGDGEGTGPAAHARLTPWALSHLPTHALNPNPGRGPAHCPSQPSHLRVPPKGAGAGPLPGPWWPGLRGGRRDRSSEGAAALGEQLPDHRVPPFLPRLPGSGPFPFLRETRRLPEGPTKGGSIWALPPRPSSARGSAATGRGDLPASGEAANPAFSRPPRSDTRLGPTDT